MTSVVSIVSVAYYTKCNHLNSQDLPSITLVTTLRYFPNQSNVSMRDLVLFNPDCIEKLSKMSISDINVAVQSKK